MRVMRGPVMDGLFCLILQGFAGLMGEQPGIL